MQNQRGKLTWCLIGNAVTLIAVIAAVTIFDESGSYMSFGPNEGLIVVSVKINTVYKYTWLLIFMSAINIVQVISEEIGTPILSFNVYNPNEKHIVGFGKLELNVLANSMYLISGVRRIFMTLITISQIDIAIASILVKEISSFFVIRSLLNAKTFGPEKPSDPIPVVVHNPDPDIDSDTESVPLMGITTMS